VNKSSIIKLAKAKTKAMARAFKNPECFPFSVSPISSLKRMLGFHILLPVRGFLARAKDRIKGKSIKNFP
jgi:hypothetical protein